MSDWLISHRSHANVILAKDNISNLRWGTTLNGVGYISYDVSKDSPLVVDVPNLRPYRQDFLLETRPGGARIMGGFITEISRGDPSNNMVSFGGKDWIHYLERTIWPKDPNSNYRLTTAVDSANGTVFEYTDPIHTLLNKLVAQAVTSGTSGISNSLDLSCASIPVSPGIVDATAYKYRIEPGDTQTILEKFLDILGLGDPQNSYAMNLMPALTNKIINLYPFGPTAPVRFKFIHGTNCEVVSMIDRGIKGTRILGIGQGFSSRKAHIATLSSSTYRRHDFVEEFPGSNAFANLPTVTQNALEDGLVPNIEVVIKYIDTPEMFLPFINELVFPGSKVELEADLTPYVFNDNWIVTSVECQADDEGVTEYTYTLNQPASFV